jgi:hypothetical protein
MCCVHEVQQDFCNDKTQLPTKKQKEDPSLQIEEEDEEKE